MKLSILVMSTLLVAPVWAQSPPPPPPPPVKAEVVGGEPTLPLLSSPPVPVMRSRYRHAQAVCEDAKGKAKVSHPAKVIEEQAAFYQNCMKKRGYNQQK